ncbi:hypothetical protein BCR44DRAFT_64552 [Catenaria anguillulae PL171]|uniref:Uncharacterized protein n=1 Tax=Catenaria anguillulae PL171 TaxID=765915 RepID=A0A1Y2HA23_9FUNG|nr:hypothetical protein BCR44DRAFT_64552 [Catenaria anguillulae PL171]
MRSRNCTRCNVFRSFRRILSTFLMSDSPYALLPAELWLNILSLCQPSPRLPATCHLTLNAFGTPGSPTHRTWATWAHLVIFLNPEFDPKVVNTSYNSPAKKCRDANLSYSWVAQIESRLSYYLKALAPSAIGGAYRVATGMAPQQAAPNARPTMLTQDFIEWLLGFHGPLGGRHGRADGRLDIVAEMRAIRNERSFVTSGLDRGTLEFPNWQPLCDALLLTHFFIRTSQFDLLQQTLTHVLNRYPSLATISAPISLWSHFMIDNRSHLLSDLSTLVLFHKDPSVSYPTFLCLLASFDWSPDALAVIRHSFSSTTAFRQVTQTITSTQHMQAAILHTLSQVTVPASTADRVLNVLSWYESHGARLGDPFVSHHMKSLYPGSYPIASQVFMEYDLPYIVQDQTWIDDAHVLASMVVDWEMNEPEGYDCGCRVELNLALEHGLLSTEHKANLLYKGEYCREHELIFLVLASCATEQEVVLVVRNALKASIYHVPDPPAVYSAILSHLPCSIDWTDAILIPNSIDWPPASLGVVLFDCPLVDPRIQWDYLRYLRQQVKWITTWTEWCEFSPLTSQEYMRLMATLIDRVCSGVTADLAVAIELWEASEAANMCAIRLVGLMHEMGMGVWRQSQAMMDVDHDGPRASVSQEQAAAIAAVVRATKAKCGTLRWLDLMTVELREQLLSGIMAVAQAHVGDGGGESVRTTGKVFLDSLAELDKPFVPGGGDSSRRY